MAQLSQHQHHDPAQISAGQNETKIDKVCQTCKQATKQLLRCSKCKKVYYCNIQCQKADWSHHKSVCNKQKGQNSEGKQNTNSKSKEQGLNQFGKLTHIGTGNFSIIYKTASKKDGQVYAIKQVQKAKVQRMRKQADIFMEKHCLNKLKGFNYAVKLYKTFQDEISLYFQMQFPQNGQIWDASKIFGIIPNSVYKYYVSHIVKAISILHNQYQIVHRDLKPQNILLDSNHGIKLIDFGTAKDLDRPDIKGAGNGLKGKKQFQHYVGTAHYMAPECIHNKASEKKSDIYSLSGVLYFLKVGSPPFQGGSQYLTFTKSLETQLFTCSQLFDQKLADLMSKMNCKDMQKRIDINQVMKHPYFQDVDFNNLENYEQSTVKITQQQRHLSELCQKLKKIMQQQKQPKIERRREIYQKQICPILSKQKDNLQNGETNANEKMRSRLEVIDIQCQCYLNIRDNNNISFSQIYKQVRNMQENVAQNIQEITMKVENRKEIQQAELSEKQTQSLENNGQ